MKIIILLVFLVIVSGCTSVQDPRENDPCEGVLCQDSTLECSDGTTSSCSNICTGGECSDCRPECLTCLEEWECGEWSDCVDGVQARTCEDLNVCGTDEMKPVDLVSCESEEVSISLINPEEEWVLIENRGSEPVDLTNWTLRDNATHVFVFPAFTLDSMTSVKINKGTDQNTNANLYWGNNLNIWNNDGDIATLYNEKGEVVSVFAY